MGYSFPSTVNRATLLNSIFASPFLEPELVFLSCGTISCFVLSCVEDQTKQIRNCKVFAKRKMNTTLQKLSKMSYKVSDP